jgi:hypothetical protein
MEPSHVLGMIAGYYLSRCDERAYQSLGFESKTATHIELARAFGTKPASVRNWRDEFGPVHDNPRRGWDKREMTPSRVRVVEALGDVSDDELLQLLRAAIVSPSGVAACRLVDLVGPADTI